MLRSRVSINASIITIAVRLVIKLRVNKLKRGREEGDRIFSRKRSARGNQHHFSKRHADGNRPVGLRTEIESVTGF